MKPTNISLHQPISVGFTVLELAKLHMYKFHYGFIKQMYANSATLLFTDTDSLTYHIVGVDKKRLDQDMYANRKYFDLSNYPRNSNFYCEQNKKCRGTFKNEKPNERIIGFVGLRAKMYCLKCVDEDTKENWVTLKRAKGIRRCVVRDYEYDSYLNVLQEGNDGGGAAAETTPQRCEYAAIR